MGEVVNHQRRYVSPRRREQAQATRHAVLDAARAMFVEGGYVASSIAAMADRANVSAETVYAVFGTKRALLAELVDISIAGGDEARPILKQAWVEQMRTEPDIRRRLSILATNGRSILERRAEIDEVVRGAAASDPEIAALWQRGKAERLAGQRELLRIVLGESGLRQGLDLATAEDILYAIGSPETYRLLVVERGWSGAQFERWYRESLSRLLIE
jgi:AcrR family transcriptional regulator